METHLVSSSKQIQNISVVFLRVEMNEIHLNEEQRGKVTESIPSMYFFCLPCTQSLQLQQHRLQREQMVQRNSLLLCSLFIFYQNLFFFNIQLELNESQKLNIEGLETNKNHLPYP